MNTDLSEIERRTASPDQYLDSLELPFREKFLTSKQTYVMNQQALETRKKGIYEIIKTRQ